jgi:hypothetical protein
MTAVTDILNNRGNTPRIYRNMLAFIAPDQDLMVSLKQEVRRYLAWKSIKEDSEDLNLDAAQNRETENNLRRSNETVDARIKEAYCWLLVPYIDKDVDMKTIIWKTIRISGGNEGIVTRAAKKMLQGEDVITQWAPTLLQMELNNILWRDSDNIAIKKLWEYLCTYCYLPRLANENVLEETIRTGLNSTEYFAFASGYDGTRYIDLKFNQYVGTIERSGYLVKVDVAQKQIADETKPIKPDPIPDPRPGPGPDPRPDPDPDPPPVVTIPKNKHFYMSAQLDTTRIGRDVQKLVEEVINHLTSLDGAQVEVSLELNVKSPDGLSQQVVRTVSENCQALKVKTFGFEE